MIATAFSLSIAGPTMPVLRSTSVERLLAAGAPFELDDAAIPGPLRYGFMAGEETPFPDIRPLSPMLAAFGGQESCRSRAQPTTAPHVSWRGHRTPWRAMPSVPITRAYFGIGQRTPDPDAYLAQIETLYSEIP